MCQFKAKLLALLMLAGCAVTEEPPQEEVVRSERPALAEWQWADGELPWGTWDESLFVHAQSEDNPILVYLATPGCEGLFPAPTPALRQLVAEKFISVQVDPFKRPDIARRYDSGGWPALVVALPDGRVFARAVDIPPANVEPYLRRLHTSYEEKREVIVAKVQRAARPKVEKPVAIDAVYRACAAAFDSAHGGFGGPTKFLETSTLRFLLTYAEARGAAPARQMALASLDAVLASPLGDSGGFRAYSYTPDWSAPAGERDALDQAAMLHLLLETGQSRYAESVTALLGFVEGTLFDSAEGVFRGRQVMADPSASSGTAWWTDPALYADRQAALIRAYLAAATALGDERAAQVAMQAGDVLISHCIDDRGRVQHVCDSEAEGSTGLLGDQALAALALWELGQWSGEARFAAAAEQVVRFMEQSYDRPAALDPLSHRGKALALQLYGRLSAELKSKQGRAERVAALVAEPLLAQASDRVHSSWARALLLYGPPL
ncbi:MAG: thioredoxin domain-containing protein [Gemmatimonadetes bacterium]|nr:thioredoxin domain-containing protein [Gemmatimonadota bacterium]MXY81673.1 thioredoxin domain-containing protein [Gemmatimonadota bacterium]MYB67258.1 thioredoxin domain-containing protein [Gemmatimonadota bacterium]